MSMNSPTELGVDQNPAPPSGPSAPSDYPRSAYAWYVVGVLTLAYLFSFVDRQIISMMIRPIKRDFGLSDAQVGLLGGTAFALFYTFFGLPVGRWADTRSRRALIAAGFVLWSLTTAGCGLAKKFWHLLLCRVGVGVGEATLSPAAYSLIVDYFPPARRATAISVYSLGIYLGSGLSLVCLGLLLSFLQETQSITLPLVGPVRPWQTVFFIVGLPGVLCASLLCTVREVPRRGRPAAAVGSAASMPLREVFAFLLAHRRTFLCLFLGMASLTFAGYANSQWIIEIFARQHGWLPARTGVVVGWIIAIAGALGAVGGGRLADTLRSRGHSDANLRAALLGAAVMVLGAVGYPLAGSGAQAAVWLTPLVAGFSAPFGVITAAIQQLAPSPMRAQATALYLFVINLLGLGCGPVAVGWLSDRLSPDGKSLHLSLLVALVSSSVSAVIFFTLGLKPYRRTCATLAAAEAAAE
jgi:MFS family permease